MRRPRHLDLDCADCDALHTRLCETNDDGTPLVSETCGRMIMVGCAIDHGGLPCMHAQTRTCDGVLIAREVHGIAPPITIVKGNGDYNERERARLEKRQDDHWKRAGRDEAVDRERAFFKKMGAEGAGGMK